MAATLSTAANLGKAPPRPTMSTPVSATATAPASATSDKPKALVPGAPPPEGPIIHTMSLETHTPDKEKREKDVRISAVFAAW